jgi:dipeptidase D
MNINIKKIKKNIDEFKLDIVKIVAHLKKQLKNHHVNHEKLKPEIVWKYFVEICQIPHVSHNEKPITNYLMKTLQGLGYKPTLDKSFNVVVHKHASKGYERTPTIGLQAHSDMVGSKGKNSQHNFDKDPIKMIQKGDLIYANDTTLGADNGIGVAMILAIFADKSLKHGPLEGIITANEETGMFGISGLDHKQLKSKFLINLDSENESEIIIGCPGSTVIETSLPFRREIKSKNTTNLQIELTNARGGHSGVVINQKRINAIRYTFFLLTFIMDKYDIRLVHFEPAGVAKNVIPSECTVHINVKTDDVTKIKELIKT